MLVQEKSKLLEDLIKIVGEKYATNDQAICIGYSRDQVITTKGPEYVVAPESTEQIQEIMKLASKYKVPVLPKGTGANMGGLVIPLYGGIILDLKRMNKIYEFDQKNMTAIVGPGVTYGQLQIDAWNKGMFVVVPSGPHSVKVIANMCGTRGIGHYAGKYGLGDNQIIGMEIVLPNGELLKLGSFAYPKEKDSANFPHGPGPDLMGLFLGGFGTVGVVTRIKIKLYQKNNFHEVISIGGNLDPLFDDIIELVKIGFSNAMIVRWPYIAFLFARTREEHFWMLEHPWIEGFILLFVEGTERDFNYYVKTIKNKYKDRKNYAVGLYSEVMKKNQHPFFVGGGPYTEDSHEFGYLKEPRKLHDFMYQSVRILRTHGGFAPHCPFFSLKDAKGIWNYMKDWILKLDAPINETCCYCQVTDDGHYVLQEMDLEFDPDPNKMMNNIKTFIGIGKPMADTMFSKFNGIQYYFYANGEILETIGPIFIPGYFYLLKEFKTLIDPYNLMNRGRGIRPKGVELESQSMGMGQAFGGSMGSMFWFQSIASVINELNYPDKDRMLKFLDAVKNKKIGEEPLQEILKDSINLSLKTLLKDKTRATADKSVGEFFKSYYEKLEGEKIVLKSDMHDLWMIELGNIEDDEPVKVYSVDKKNAKKIPSIMTDYIFTKKALIGEEVDPMLAMLKPEVGKFTIMHAIMAWSNLIERFSDAVIIGTARLLYERRSLNEINIELNKKIDIILNKINY
ncbi:MAG: FAD-binding oxidoreductase [Candidatus Lokiarchaeota archaeon]|nr:FAD-binding oxidoreductase [Candidatus Lokiarchaeota archaeon]